MEKSARRMIRLCLPTSGVTTFRVGPLLSGGLAPGPPCPHAFSVPWVPALGRREHLGPVEAVVEIRVQVVRLEGQQRAERTRVPGETPIALVDIVAVGDGRGHGLFAV